MTRCGSGVWEGLPGSVGHCQGADVPHSSDSSWPGSQFLRLLLRNHQLAGKGLSAGQTGSFARNNMALFNHKQLLCLASLQGPHLWFAVHFLLVHAKFFMKFHVGYPGVDPCECLHETFCAISCGISNCNVWTPSLNFIGAYPVAHPIVKIECLLEISVERSCGRSMCNMWRAKWNISGLSLGWAALIMCWNLLSLMRYNMWCGIPKPGSWSKL